MARLLFLIADTGGGHRAAATAVARQLEASAPGRHDIRIVDPFAEASPKIVSRTAELYGPLTRRAALGWGALYHATNSRPAVAAIEGLALRLVDRGIARCAVPPPAAIVSFHPLLNHPAVRVARRLSPRPPVMTVITDLVDVHASWACAGVDAVVVPSPGGWDRCRRAGIPADRCYEIGLAVDPAYAQGPPGPEERRALREQLGLSPDRFVVLLCGGADGSGGLARRARALVSSGLDIDLAVICGRNIRCTEKLAKLVDQNGRRVPVHAFVDNMRDWIRAADLVATKAGPSTIAESMCCGVPLLLTFYLPGQERGNVEWVVDSGAGRYVPLVRHLVDAVAELSAPGSPAYARMRATVPELARPEATERIADLIDRMATTGTTRPG
jgi:1,2-diacylglycerol 3-beta-galactosyltransferase